MNYKEIEEEIDEKFCGYMADGRLHFIKPDMDGTAIKSFLKSKLKEQREISKRTCEDLIELTVRKQREELRGKIEKIKERFRCSACDGAKCHHTLGCEALKEVLKLL